MIILVYGYKNESLHVSCLIVILAISHFSFEGGILVMIASVPGHCLPFNNYIRRGV